MLNDISGTVCHFQRGSSLQIKLLVSVRGNGIQRPGEALSVSRSLSQIRPARRNAIGRPGFLKEKFQLVVYLLIAGGGADGKRLAKSLVCAVC